MIEINKCPVCEGSTFAPYLSCTDHAVSHETFTLIRCNTCELLMTSPRPSIDELERYYLSDAYTSHIAKPKTALDKIYAVARTFTLKWKLSLVDRYAAPSSKKMLLDFGTGVGEFLKTAKQRGWQAMGIEPSPLARKNADPGISTDINASLQDIEKQVKFDAITAWHVLEHVEELNNTIEALRNRLSDDGTIFIAVPNHKSWDADHYQQYWAGYDVPRHLWHFNIQSMKQLLEKHTLHVASIIPMRLDAFYISLLSEKYQTGSLPVARLAKPFINGMRSNQHARKTMQYSSLIYIARR